MSIDFELGEDQVLRVTFRVPLSIDLLPMVKERFREYREQANRRVIIDREPYPP